MLGFHKHDVRGTISLDPHCCCSLWETVYVYLSFLHIRLKLSWLFILPQGTAQNMKVLLQYIRWNSNSYQHLLKYLLLNASYKSLSYVASWNEGACYTEQDFHRQLLVSRCQEKVDLQPCGVCVWQELFFSWESCGNLWNSCCAIYYVFCFMFYYLPIKMVSTVVSYWS